MYKLSYSTENLMRNLKKPCCLHAKRNFRFFFVSFLSRLHGVTWTCFPEIHPKSCFLTCFLKCIYIAFKCWWFQTFCDLCYMAYSYFEEIETILWIWKIMFWGWEGSPLPCTSSSVKPVSASTSKTCQGEANLGRIHFFGARRHASTHTIVNRHLCMQIHGHCK